MDRVNRELQAFGIEMKAMDDPFGLMDVAGTGHLDVKTAAQRCLQLRGKATSHSLSVMARDIRAIHQESPGLVWCRLRVVVLFSMSSASPVAVLRCRPAPPRQVSCAPKSQMQPCVSWSHLGFEAFPLELTGGRTSSDLDLCGLPALLARS